MTGGAWWPQHCLELLWAIEEIFRPKGLYSASHSRCHGSNARKAKSSKCRMSRHSCQSSRNAHSQSAFRMPATSKGPQTLGSLSSAASTGPNCSFRHVFWRSREQSFFDFYSVALQLRGFRRASRGKPRPGLRTACCNGSIGMGSRAITLRQAAASSED